VNREGNILIALVLLLVAGLVAAGIATGAGDHQTGPALAHVEGRLVVCDRLPVQRVSSCERPADLSAIRIHIVRRDHRYHGLWEGTGFGGVFPPGRYTAFGSLNGLPIRRVSFRLTLAHPTHLVLVAAATRT
jgi:hypothetical protein